MAAINPLVLGMYTIGLGALVSGIYFLDLYAKTEQDSNVNKGFGLMILLSGIGAIIIAMQLVYVGPLPGTYSEFFGTPLAVFGLVSLGAGYSIYKGLDLKPLSWFSAGAGVIAACNAYLTVTHYTRNISSYLPIFGLSSLSGLSLLLAYHVEAKWARRLAGLLLILLAGACLYIGTRAFIGHMTGVH